MSRKLLDVASENPSNTTQEMVVSADELDSMNHDHSLLTRVAVTVASCILVAILLISCVYFRKWKYRRRPAENAAFYTNAGFDDFPQGQADHATAKKLKQDQSLPGVHPNPTNGDALFNLSDLPPHPASQFNKPYPMPYQLDPQGYVEQNLYASRSPDNSPKKNLQEGGKSNGGIPSATNLSQVHPTDSGVSHDIMFSNPVAKDFTQDDKADSPDGVESGYETIDLGESPEENPDGFIMANPAAFKEYV